MGISHLVWLLYTTLISLSVQIINVSAKEQPKDFYIRKMDSWVFIDSNTLESVVDRKVPLPFYDSVYNMTFFSRFVKFWMRFDLNQDANTTVLQKIAERNKVISEFVSYKKFTQVFIAFVPKGDILEDLRIVLAVVGKANKVFPGTVPFLIVNYGFLLLDCESVILVNHDIKRVTGELARLNNTIFLGIQLDSLNCIHRKKYLGVLDLREVNTVLFVPQENSKFGAVYGEDLLDAIPHVGCLNIFGDTWEERGKIIISFGQGIPLAINLNEEYFKFNKFNEMGKFYDLHSQIGILLFKAKLVQGIGTEYKMKGDKLGLKSFDEWIEQPLQFNRSHFGAVIDIQNASRLLVSSTLANFRKIAIENIFVNVTDPASQLVFNLLNNSNSSDKQVMPLEISLLVNVMSSEISREQMAKAVAIAAVAHALSPGAVRSIVFDSTSCWRSPNCTGNDLQKDKCSIFKTFVNLKVSLLHSKFLLRSENLLNDVRVGFVINAAYLNKMISFSSKNCSTRKKRSTASYGKLSQYIVVCRSVLLNKDIEEKGVDKCLVLVVDELNRCTIFANSVSFPFLIEKTVTYHVRVVDCYGSGSNISHFAGYASLLEELSKWAVSVNVQLFVDAGIEHEEECTLNQQFQSKGNCTCGWWKKIQSGNGTVLIDKKRFALKLHRENIVPLSAPVKPTPSKEMLPYILVPAVLITIFVTMFATFLVLRYRSKDIISKQEVTEFVYGSRGKKRRNRDGDEITDDGNSSAENEPFNAKKYEMATSSFTIDKSRSLGAGEFGKVFRGIIKQGDVQVEAAVKVATVPFSGKGHGYYLAVKGLITEIKILSFLGEHKHIVSLLGAYTAKLRKGDIAVFLELCPLGSLDKFLRSYKPQENIANVDGTISRRYVETKVSTASEEHNTAIEMMTFVLDSEIAMYLQRWAGEIACGMEFVSSKKLVHADLATRNILLTTDKVAKISDFGLSRRLYDYSEYVKRTQCALPWRWMAPESLRRSIFTEKSDVWAFGVTLWELYTLGDEPYPGLSWNPNFPAMLERGLQLNEPRYSTGHIYEIMKSCWETNSALRPGFAQLNTELNKE